MNESRESKNAEQLEELLLLTEEIQEELEQKEQLIVELKTQLSESLTLNEKLNKENINGMNDSGNRSTSSVFNICSSSCNRSCRKGVAEGDVGKRSVEIVGEAHDMNYKKVMRYLRLNSLVPELLDKERQEKGLKKGFF